MNREQETVQWYALHVKARSERVVASIARNKGYEEFVPTSRCRRRWSDRIKVIETALFPGYVFCRFDVHDRLPILTIPGLINIVGAGKSPLPVDETEIAAIQAVVQAGLAAEPYPFLSHGAKIRLDYGPLAGTEGIYLEGRKQDRIVVSVSLLQRSVAIEIDRDWVTPVGPASRNYSLEAAAIC